MVSGVVLDRASGGTGAAPARSSAHRLATGAGRRKCLPWHSCFALMMCSCVVDQISFCCARTVLLSSFLPESVASLSRRGQCEDMLLHARMSGCTSRLPAAFVTHPALLSNADPGLPSLVCLASFSTALPERQALRLPAPRLTDWQRAPDAGNVCFSLRGSPSRCARALSTPFRSIVREPSSFCCFPESVALFLRRR